MKSGEQTRDVTFSTTNENHNLNFIPTRSIKQFRLIFQNLDTVKLYQDNELQSSLEKMKSFRGDIMLLQEVNINLNTYTNRRIIERLSRKKSSNYRFKYKLGGTETSSSKIKGGLLTIHHPYSSVHIINDVYCRWK